MHPTHSGHARIVAPDAGYHVDSKGHTIKTHPGTPASIGPHTVIILAGQPPKTASEYYHGGGLPPQITAKANKHPKHVLHKMAHHAPLHTGMAGKLPPAPGEPPLRRPLPPLPRGAAAPGLSPLPRGAAAPGLSPPAAAPPPAREPAAPMLPPVPQGIGR